jgi:transcriptional regulator with GAF, ATPase, and Fis domain
MQGRDSSNAATTGSWGDAGHGVFHERRSFDRLLVPFSARCMNAPLEHLDRDIEQGLREVKAFFGGDRLLLWEFSEDGKQANITHASAAESADPPSSLLLHETLPYIFDSVRGFKNLCVSRLADLPQDAVIDRQYLERSGIRSFLVIPLMVGGTLRGALSLAYIRTERAWSNEDLFRFQRIGSVLSGALDRKRSHHLLERRMQFEALITDLSARLIKAPMAEVDAEIEQALTMVRKIFQTDRCALLAVHPDRKYVHVTHASYGEGVKQVSGDINLADLFPWSYERLVVQGGIINYSRMEEIPAEEMTEHRSRSAIGIRSALSVPLFVEGRVAFLIVLNAVREERSWPEEFVPRLRLLGEIIVSALERKDDRLKLVEQLRFEMLLAEISGRFVNLPTDLVDSEIMNAERRICGLLDLDIAAIWQWSAGPPGFFELTHYYSTQDGPQPSMKLSESDFPWFKQLMLDGRIVPISSLDDMPAEASLDRENCRRLGIKSNLCLPLTLAGVPIGILGFNTIRAGRDWPEPLVKRLQLFAQIFTNALARKSADAALRDSKEQLQTRLEEIERLKQKIEKENLYLREEASLLYEHGDIVCGSMAMKTVLAQAEQVARTDSTVLITGETGTGKELLAREIHNLSTRKDRTLVTVNCASLPPTLIESELFGREKGAYTGAMTRMAGRFEVADGSTIFLDEIAELPLDLQSKLLRVIEEGTFERLGSTNTIHVNVRVIAATNRDLQQEVQKGSFRRDLFYRLNVFPIHVPPLRDRVEDIPPLVWAFVRQFEKKMGKQIENIPKRSMGALQNYSWPGNVRELRNVIEHAMIVTRSKTLEVGALSAAGTEPPAYDNNDFTLEAAERRHILSALQKSGWRIDGAGGAAEALGLKRTTLQSKMKRLGIERPSN